MSDDNLEKYSGNNLAAAEKASNRLPYPASRLAPAMDLVNTAREIASANNMVHQQTNAKLQVIARQIQALQLEAQRILDEARQDQALHQAECNFKKQPGRIYHLYQRPEGKQYFSMLSPEEWGRQPPHRYIGSFRLEQDMSWTAQDQRDRHEDTALLVEQLLRKEDLD